MNTVHSLKWHKFSLHNLAEPFTYVRLNQDMCRISIKIIAVKQSKNSVTDLTVPLVVGEYLQKLGSKTLNSKEGRTPHHNNGHCAWQCSDKSDLYY